MKTDGSAKNRLAICPPTHLIFGTVKYMVSIFYDTKNHVHGLCVGGAFLS